MGCYPVHLTTFHGLPVHYFPTSPPDAGDGARALDLDHHYMSEPVTDRLRETLAPHGVRLSLAPAHRRRPDEDRHVAVGE